MSELVLVTDGLTKTYGSRQAVRGLDLEVRSGEVFGFLGPNGAGKTTTIRMCLGLIRPTSGRAGAPRPGRAGERPRPGRAAAGAVGRSMTFAMAVAAGFFPVDNGLGYVLPVLQNATQERVWADLTTYLLGPTLNHLPSVLMGRRAGELVPPQLPVDAIHSLLVIAGYVAALIAAAALVAWRRDTLE